MEITSYLRDQNKSHPGLRRIGLPHTCYPSYGGLALTPAGFNSLLNTLAFIGHTDFWTLRGQEISGSSHANEPARLTKSAAVSLTYNFTDIGLSQADPILPTSELPGTFALQPYEGSRRDLA